MKDTRGREYAKLSELKAGDTVEVDDGFTCMHGQKTIKLDDEDEALYVQCSSGNHYLAAQVAEDGDSLIGIYPVQP